MRSAKATPPNKPTEYVELSQDQIDNLGQLSPEEILLNTIETKLLALEIYHHSETTRAVKVDTHTILNTFEFRSLIAEQKDGFAEKIDLGLIAEKDATFNYQYNGSGLIPITYVQLRQLLITLKDLAGVNYSVRVAHRDAIHALTSLNAIKAYDFTANYVIDQILSL